LVRRHAGKRISAPQASADCEYGKQHDREASARADPGREPNRPAGGIRGRGECRRLLSALDTLSRGGDRAALTLQPAARGRPAMLSQETLDQYRRMTGIERLKLSLKMTEENIPAFFVGSPELIERRFELLKRENDARNRNMLTAIARTRKQP
jgi:hypothetical protein